MIQSTHSILDSDLYKFTMQQAVLQKFPRANIRYTFINRGEHEFTAEMINLANIRIKEMESLQLQDDEYQWLKETCSYFNPAYLDFLKSYRYNSKEVSLEFAEKPEGKSEVIMNIEGPWYRTILWEVPLMAIMSEVFHECNGDFEKYNLDIELEKIKEKGERLDMIGAQFAEFGTRRRFSLAHQDLVVRTLTETCPDTLVGSSNLFMAYTHNIKPIGTQAHEWFMFHGAKYGYLSANEKALESWVDVYEGDLGIALSDTFTTDEFFRVFSKKYAKLFDGLRQDSGEPLSFMHRTCHAYSKLGIDPSTKTIVYSDGLDIDKVDYLFNVTKENMKCSFGIGTHLTCDITDVRPMNMVIKMSECKPDGELEWLPCVKLSDSPGKHTGQEKAIKLCLETIKGTKV